MLLDEHSDPRTHPVHPYALTNPIWVDVDGGGFDALASRIGCAGGAGSVTVRMDLSRRFVTGSADQVAITVVLEVVFGTHFDPADISCADCRGASRNTR